MRETARDRVRKSEGYEKKLEKNRTGERETKEGGIRKEVSER